LKLQKPKPASSTARFAMILLVFGLPLPAFGDRAPTPDIVVDVMTHLGFESRHKESLEEGEILFTGQPDLEPLPQGIAVGGAMMLIGRPPHELVDAYLSDETLRSHSDILTAGEVPAEGGDVSELANFDFSEEEQNEVRRLLRAQAGDDFNLARTEIERISTIPDNTDEARQVVAVYRDALWMRLDAYRTSGLDGILPYARNSGEPASPAEEMRASLDSAVLLKKHFPDMHRALQNYPESMDAITESRLLWIKKIIADRPTVALVHRLLLIDGDIAIVAEREFYVGHTYNSMLTIAAVAPYAEGALVFAANRTYTEKVRGASFMKAIGRKKVASKFAERFEHLRSLLHSSQASTLPN
jgi:hypothetical protein